MNETEKIIHFKIITPEQVVYESEIEKLVIQTQMGQIAILPEHMPLVALLAPGEMVVHKKDGEHAFATAEGIVEVKRGSGVTVLADVAVRAEDIDAKAAEAARERAAYALSQKQAVDSEEFAMIQATLEREMAKLKIARKHRERDMGQRS